MKKEYPEGLKIRCDFCLGEFILIPKDILCQEINLLESNETLYLSYFECPKCKEKYMLYLDNGETQKLEIPLKKHKESLRALRFKGQNPNTHILSQLEINSQRLGNMRKALIVKYNHKSIKCGGEYTTINIKE